MHKQQITMRQKNNSFFLFFFKFFKSWSLCSSSLILAVESSRSFACLRASPIQKFTSCRSTSRSASIGGIMRRPWGFGRSNHFQNLHRNPLIKYKFKIKLQKLSTDNKAYGFKEPKYRILKLATQVTAIRVLHRMRGTDFHRQVAATLDSFVRPVERVARIVADSRRGSHSCNKNIFSLQSPVP